jgi:hypothetical protein
MSIDTAYALVRGQESLHSLSTRSGRSATIALRGNLGVRDVQLTLCRALDG